MFPIFETTGAKQKKKMPYCPERNEVITRLNQIQIKLHYPFLTSCFISIPPENLRKRQVF